MIIIENSPIINLRLDKEIYVFRFRMVLQPPSLDV